MEVLPNGRPFVTVAPMSDLPPQPGLPPQTPPLDPQVVENNRRVADAMEAHMRGDFVAAESVYRQVLEVDPIHAGALQGMGVICYQANRLGLAIDYLEASLRVRETDAVAHANLANCFRAVRKWGKAVDHYTRATELQPMLRDAWAYLSESLINIRQYERARRAALRACALSPDRSDGWFRLAEAERMLGHPLEARAAYETYLRMEPGDRLGARIALSTVGGALLDRVPPDFVTRLFDDYASSFDYHLVVKLGYTAPRHLHNLLRDWLATRTAPITIADLGCGTGLVGQEFAQPERVIDGVDLSSAMVERAEEKAVYATLVVGDLVDFLTQPPRPAYDLLVAADVLNYFGDLSPVLTAARPLMKPDGRFVFSLERSETTLTYEVGERLRYRHNADHVTQLAAQAGFACLGITDAILRKEAGRPVRAIVVQLTPLAVE